jgi:acetylene hydratase
VEVEIMGTIEKSVICASCDISCFLSARVEDGRVTKVSSSSNPIFRDNICMKGIYAPRSFSHPDRVLYPLKRVGERGSGHWQQVSWDDAMDDIGRRLATIIDQYGPEGMAVATSQWNTSVDNGAGRRLMNLLGAPNWISGVALCAGNTGAINRMVYGWMPQPDYSTTQCIVLFGHNPRRHSWTPVYNNIRRAQNNGAQLIVLDPRRSESAERADIWLPLKAGTDAAMCLGWLNVIINEELYDKDFVKKWTVGFEALRERVNQYPLDRVASITGVDAQLIRRAACLYATTSPAIIPWGPITDQQINSTSAIRLQCSLRALTGNIDIPGGEVFHGLHPLIIPETDMELHGTISQQQKDKQLGADTHPAFTYRGTAALTEPTRKVWGRPYVNLVMGSYMANPLATFKAMAYGKPYPVKALISLGNNTLMGFSSMKLIYKAMMNQDLIVVHEHMKTPTAQLADYILPGDSWLERPYLSDAFAWAAIAGVSEQAMEPPGECKSVYYFWRELAIRLGQGEHFPWQTLEQVYDYRLQNTGMNFEEFSKTYEMDLPLLDYKKYERTGFATPSGKVELSSSILGDLGFDPLPYYREAPQPDKAFPLSLIMGVRDDEFFQTGHRHVPELRKRKPHPTTYIHPDTAKGLDLAAGEWVEVETRAGKMKVQVEIRNDMPRDLIRVPHGWWLPETPQGKDNLSSAWDLSDGMITSDDEAFLDREQGIPHLRGIPCRINKVTIKDEPYLSDGESSVSGGSTL